MELTRTILLGSLLLLAANAADAAEMPSSVPRPMVRRAAHDEALREG